MNGGPFSRWSLLAVMACLHAPVSAQTRFEAPGGVAAGAITNSPITIGLPPTEQVQLVAVFSQQIAMSNEARTKAEASAAELSARLGVTREAVIGFFRIVGEQDVGAGRWSAKY